MFTKYPYLTLINFLVTSKPRPSPLLYSRDDYSVAAKGKWNLPISILWSFEILFTDLQTLRVASQLSNILTTNSSLEIFKDSPDIQALTKQTTAAHGAISGRWLDKGELVELLKSNCAFQSQKFFIFLNHLETLGDTVDPLKFAPYSKKNKAKKFMRKGIDLHVLLLSNGLEEVFRRLGNAGQDIYNKLVKMISSLSLWEIHLEP